ncbi:hypothetical protein pdam_00025512, partial [Pocillopora damicornis]
MANCVVAHDEELLALLQRTAHPSTREEFESAIPMLGDFHHPWEIMPGDNCAVFGCGTSRRTKGIGIWKLPAPKDEAHKKWRQEWLNEITKTRESDAPFKVLVAKDRIFTCEKHFEPEDVEIFHSEKMIKKKARFGALPKLSMPKKTHETSKPEQRPEQTIVRDLIKKPQVHYKTFTEFCQRLTKLKSLQNWNIGTFSDRVVLKQVEIPYVLPKFEIVVDDRLAFTSGIYPYVVLLNCSEKAKKAKDKHQLTPAHVNAPISKTDPERIKLTLRQQRL